MSTTEKVLEMRGMHRSQIINYFYTIRSKNIGCGKFSGKNWEVEIGVENLITIGSIKIPSTMVTFKGENDLLKKIIYAFRLKFLSAGG